MDEKYVSFRINTLKTKLVNSHTRPWKYPLFCENVWRNCKIGPSFSSKLNRITLAKTISKGSPITIYFRYILDEYANARRTLIAEAFLQALTIGSAGESKPIELQSYDPLRYSGDMLAWLHQAVASEKEYLRSLTTNKS